MQVLVRRRHSDAETANVRSHESAIVCTRRLLDQGFERLQPREKCQSPNKRSRKHDLNRAKSASLVRASKTKWGAKPPIECSAPFRCVLGALALA